MLKILSPLDRRGLIKDLELIIEVKDFYSIYKKYRYVYIFKAYTKGIKTIKMM